MATLLSSKAVGSIIKLYVSGTATNFIVVHQGLPSSDYDSSCDGTWLLRETVQSSSDVWDDEDNDYANSAVHSYLNTRTINWFDSNTQSVIKQVKLPYTNGTGSGGSLATGSSGISAKLFLLSYDEIGLRGANDNTNNQLGYDRSVNTEGAVLDYFDGASSSDRIGYYNGTATGWWLRSPDKSSTLTSLLIDTGGHPAAAGVYGSSGLRPALVLPKDLMIDDDGYIVFNTAPVISGSDSALGTFTETAPSYSYTVTDAEDSSLTVTEKLDGTTLRTYTATSGATNTLTFTDLEWMKILNGSHTLTITAADPDGETATRTVTLTKSVTSLSFTLETPLDADDMITRAIEVISASIPDGATITIEVCNNGYDASPTWEDVTDKVLAGEKFYIANQTKTADKWGYNLRVNVERGTATGDCYVVSMIGNFE